jgi:ABC-type sugar transport system substrate-binding protein
MSQQPLVTLQNVGKTFGPVTVIKDVTVSVYAGQIQVLLGENGAGKSTLIKMMAGVYQPDSGHIVVDGQTVTLPTTRAVEELGIATIHQELNLVPTMSIAENVMLGRMPSSSASRDRGAGFEEGMKAYPNITVVAKQTANFDRAAALDVTTNLLQAHPDVTGLFAENDEMALGAIQALGSRAGTEVSVVGFDGTADGLAAIKKGTLVATIAQQPAELGKLAIELAVKAIKGDKIKKTVPVEVVSVTKTNVGDFLK